MNNGILLEEELGRGLDELKGTDMSSEEYAKKLDAVAKLMDKSIELKKVEDSKKDRLIGYAMNAAGILLPIAVTIWGVKVSYKYDKDGIVPTTILGRGFVNKLLPKK